MTVTVDNLKYGGEFNGEGRVVEDLAHFSYSVTAAKLLDEQNILLGPPTITSADGSVQWRADGIQLGDDPNRALVRCILAQHFRSTTNWDER